MSGDEVWVTECCSTVGQPDAISGETILGSLAEQWFFGALEFNGSSFRIHSRVCRRNI
jgi:hypothetical protein